MCCLFPRDTYNQAGVDWPSGMPGIVLAQRALTVLSITTQTRVGRDLTALAGESRDGLLLRQKLKMDNKSKKRPGGAEKHRRKKLKSLWVEAATCAKLTDLFGAGFTSPAAAGAPGDERGGLDNDERVEADMVDHLTCESLRSCFPDTGRANRGVTLGLPFWAGLQLQI
ncbi:unnamed protein product [Pleuronectes platessa]|uniref:Uncharacterized protein n=1 Tax=Pleuronectes platessa TaxID=8262 RepID=A0A9N7USE3_PLEPL|nr:unnamed protein product [Pleuronectes platessa]